MVEVSNKHKSITVSVSSNNGNTIVTAKSDTSQYWANQSHTFADQSKESAQEAKNYAELANSYIEGFENVVTNNANNIIATGNDYINQITETKNAGIEEITTAKEEAVENITTVKSESIASVEAKGNEANALVNAGIANINTARTEAVNAVTNTKNNAVTEINKEVTDGKKELNDIIEAGGSNINDKITNCLLEVPQRINLALNNGTLTLKKGSVVIVPYGTTNRTSEFPIGSQFVNSYWKVTDTQFADNKFFVWVELQQDISNRRTENNNQTRFISIYITNTSGQPVINGAVSAISGTTFKNQLGYNTSKNEVHWYNTDGSENPDILAFPIGIVSADGTEIFASINQVFNGMGYIGQIFWVDKGVKGLIANGRNEDGTLKNIEFKTNKMEVCSIHKDTGSARTIVLYWNGTELNKGIFSNVINDVMTSRFYQQEETPTKSDTQLWYKPSENIFYGYKTTGDWQQVYPVIFDTQTICDGVLKNFNPKKAFRAVDYQDAVLKDSLQEVDVVVESYNNGRSGYRIWSNGKMEQWGATSGNTVTFVKPFSSVPVVVAQSQNSTICEWTMSNTVSETGFSGLTNSHDSWVKYLHWWAYGDA